MSRAIEAGAPVEAKRKKGLGERWHAATMVRYDLRTPIVRFKGEREETAAFKVREPKEKAPRKPAPPVVRTDADVAAILPPTFGQMRPLPPEAEAFAVFAPSAQPRAVEKPGKPARCRPYMDWIKQFPCLNCEAPADVVVVDPHHQRLAPEDLAVGRKVSDFLTCPLCRTCHSAYEDKNTLPRRTEFESLELMRDAQIRFMSIALGRVPAAVLRKVLLEERTTGATT